MLGFPRRRARIDDRRLVVFGAVVEHDFARVEEALGYLPPQPVVPPLIPMHPSVQRQKPGRLDLDDEQQPVEGFIAPLWIACRSSESVESRSSREWLTNPFAKICSAW